MNDEFESYLRGSEFIDPHHPLVRGFLPTFAKSATHQVKAMAIYLRVRDGIRYNPFDIRFQKEALHVCQVLRKRHGHCVDKALVFIALCRAEGIPARLGLAKVRNHMGTERLEALLGSQVLAPHGYAQVYLNGKWVKCTPAFNQELCDHLGVEALEFDGERDSIFQAYDRSGAEFMEYLEDYGTFADLPVVMIQEVMQATYPHLFNDEGEFLGLPTS